MHPSPSDDAMSRRRLLQWIGGVSTLLATPSCVRRTRDFLIPYERMPEHMIPGQPISYATAMPWEGYGIGVLVKTDLGRPIKIEGNPDHPASLGASDIFAQASVLSLYDPERAQRILNRQSESTWTQFVAALQSFMKNPATQRPGRMRVVAPAESSPTLLDQIARVQQAYPGILWHRFDPLSSDIQVFESLYDFSRADIVVSFDCDFFSQGPGRLAYARAFTDRRRGEGSMNRLYSLHTSASLVSAYADHRLPLSIAGLRSALIALSEALNGSLRSTGVLTGDQKNWIETLAQDLKSRRGRSILLMDSWQSEDMQQLAWRINASLGNIGQTIHWIEAVRGDVATVWHSERDLIEAMATHEVDGIFFLGVNPLYHSSAHERYRQSLPHLAFSAQISPYRDETGAFVQWQIPQHHYLESWADIRAFDGTATILQPSIDPLFASQSMLACVQAMLPTPPKSEYDCVRAYWQNQRGGPHFADEWEEWLRKGFIPGTKKVAREFNRPAPAIEPKGTVLGTRPEAAKTADLILRPDPTVWDGTVANNPWLQELPKPFSKLTWDHALSISPALAQELNVQTGDWVELLVGNKKHEVPVHVLQQQPIRTMTLTLGYGRQSPGLLCSGIGTNAFSLRQPDGPWSLEQVGVQKLERRSHRFAFTQTHFEAYPHEKIVRKVDWQEFLKDPEQFNREATLDPQTEPTIPIDSHRVLGKAPDPLQWGMSIDTSSCIGCNACVIACQAENNIPVVGKEQIQAGRSMHWLRIDTYLESPLIDSDLTFQPVPCMHCETAPCEVVCPVGATTHSEQGLNQMVYNRCVGTRYCSNNCPYKVRHFNFYAYAETNTFASLQRNPDVTVRSRGVMEKCTYCVQRISAVRSQAEREDRAINDGELKTACAEACPTRSITFGNIADPSSQVSREKRSPRRYALLGELNTRPRTTYLAHLKNFNELLKKISRKAGL